MADKKIEKALYGPSITEVILGAILGFLVGIVAACVFLTFKPVKSVMEIPKEPERDVVYYIPGTESSQKSRTWQTKRKEFLAGTTVRLVEDELNAWAGTLAEAAPPAAKPAKDGAAKPDQAAAPSGIFIPGKPNFRIREGRLQIALPCTLNWFGVTKDVTIVATGAFRRSGDEFIFDPESVYLGSCPLHLLPNLAGMLVSHLTSKERIPDEIRTAWVKLTDVGIENGALKLAAQ
jgi:hypothetical protein